MIRLGRALAALVLLSMALIAGIGSAGAQGATPISVPTPTAAGCGQIPAYLEERQKIMDEMLNGLGAVFPTVGTPVMEHGDDLFAAMMVATPEQYKALGELYNQTAEKIAKVKTPDIAVFYNDQVVVLYQLSGATFIEAGTTDLNTAGTKYTDQLTALAAAIQTYSTAATAICPAFADVVTFDQTQVGM
jgi:hypothetical protein